jgi:hypothetical protein
MYTNPAIIQMIIFGIAALGFLPGYLFRGKIKEWLGRFKKKKDEIDDERKE